MQVGPFANANKVMGNNMPNVWKELFNVGNNITTEQYVGGSNNESDNYGYSIYGNPEFNGNWYSGRPGYEVSNLWDYSQREKIWRLNKHKGIPFTQYEYAKPN